MAAIAQGCSRQELDLIARRLGLDIKAVKDEEAKDLCFAGACGLCTDRNWVVITGLKDPLNRLVNSSGQTLLPALIMQEDRVAFDKLIASEIAVHTPSENGRQPIHYAAEKGLVPYVKTLSHHNLMDAVDSLGRTAMHLAAFNGHKDMVDYILEACPSTTGYRAQWEYGLSKLKLFPVGLSIMGGHIPCVDSFLKNPETKLHWKFKGIGNYLHLTIFFGQNLLLERLLTLYFEKFSSQIEEENEKGITPLMLAAKLGNLDAMKLLLEKGANPNGTDFKGNTPLHWAVMGRQAQAALLLLQKKANIHAENRDPKGRVDAARLAKSLNYDSLYNFLTNAKQGHIGAFDLQNALKLKFRVLVLQGGGIKGLAQAGSIQALERAKIMPEIKRIGATSAGGLNGVLVATGYSSAEMLEIITSMDFMNLFDNPIFKNTLEAKADPSFQKTMKLLGSLIEGIRKQGSITNTIRALWHTTGICPGKKALDLIEKYQYEKTKIHHMTFKELRELVIKDPQTYKHLYLFATKIGPNHEILCMNSEDSFWDDFVISFAARGSMSIPVVFEPVVLHIKVKNTDLPNGYKVVPHPDNYVVVDGGLLCNLGVERFDRKWFTTPHCKEKERDFPVFNTEVLGLSFFDPTKLPVFDRQPNDINEFLQDIVGVYFSAEKMIRNLNPYNKSRIAEVSTCGIGTLKFNLSDSEKQDLIQSGVLGIEKFLENHGFKDLDLSEEKERKPAPVLDLAPVQMQYSQVPRQTVFRDPGLYLLAKCERISCAQFNAPQWIRFADAKDEPKEIDFGKIKAQLTCPPPCRQTLSKLEKIALSRCSATMSYGDSIRGHEKFLEAKDQAQIVEWPSDLRYLSFKNVRIIKK